MKRLGSIVLALAVVGISCAFGVIGLLFTGFRCWESCEDPPEVWSDDPDSWQWDALGALGLATTAASIVFLVGIALGRRALSLAALGATALLALAFALVDNISAYGLIGLTGIVVAGVGAMALTSPERPAPGTLPR